MSDKTKKRSGAAVSFLIRASTGDHYTGVLEPEDDPGFAGYYNGHMLELPGCVSYGEDLSSAKRNLRDALELYLQD